MINVFTIERIRTKKGEIHERELRRKGQRVAVEILQIGIPLFLRYIDDSDKLLKTSAVEAYSADGLDSDNLIIQTRNSIYCLRKEGVA